MVAEPLIDMAEKANGNRSVQGRAVAAPWESASMGFLGDTLLVAMAQVADDFPDWSIYPARRDAMLRKFWKKEAHLAGTIYARNAKIRALPFKIKGDQPRIQKRFQDLLGTANWGAGAADLFGRIQLDLDTQDNGAFVELIGAGRPDRPLVGPVLQIANLDAARCWRTFDPDFPVLYVNPYTGEFHKLHSTRVLTLSSCPQPDELARGIGYCGVSRALMLAQTMRDINIYKREKVSGRFKRAIGWGSGFTPKGFDAAVEQADEQNDAKGFTRFAQIPFVFSAREASLNLLDLASLPDGYDSQTETTLYMYSLALAFGMDAREIWPATASGATKADASIQHLKAQTKGWGDLISTIEHAFNWNVFPEGTELEFEDQDGEREQQEAQTHQLRIQNEDFLVKNGTLTPVEGKSILVSQGVIDPDDLNKITEPVIVDDNAPADLSQQAPITTVPSQAPQPTPQPVPPKSPIPVASKEDAPPADPPKPEIKGEPLPADKATEVKPVTEDEIARLADLYAKLQGEVKRA